MFPIESFDTEVSEINQSISLDYQHDHEMETTQIINKELLALKFKNIRKELEKNVYHGMVKLRSGS